MKESIDLKSLLAETFKAEEVALNGATQEDFFQQRKQAFTQFEEMGFPTTRH